MLAANATLVGRRDHTPDIATFLVRPDDPTLTHAPGQYSSLGLVVDDRPLQRPYSMASVARLGEAWEFHIRRVPGGAFTQHLWRLAAGSRLSLGPPKGRFVLDPADERPHLLVATGTGIAPFVAMIRDDRANGRQRPLVLVHGVAHADELVLADTLARLARDDRSTVRYLPTVSRAGDPRSAGWSGFTGRAEWLLARRWEALHLDPASTVAYLCGNPGMVSAATTALAAVGVNPAHVHREAYWPERADVAA